MQITSKQLIEIEQFVGHGCEASVCLGMKQGALDVRVCGNGPDGMRHTERVQLTDELFMNGGWDKKLYEFKRRVKYQFDLIMSTDI